MSEHTRILSLPLIQGGQAQKHVTHNEAIRKLDALVQPVVADLDLTAPPESPQAGDRHIVAAGATDAWQGKAGSIAVREDNAWAFFAPSRGWRVHVEALGTDVVFDGAAWTAPALGRQQSLGINTGADATNRLAISAEATLLSHDGAGHQLKVNKAAASDTASLLFQTGFSGRAEMGTAGNDNFSVKVSADGVTFREGIRVEATSGIATFPNGVKIGKNSAAGHLDDYRQGSWTPVMGPLKAGDYASATGITVIDARYVKVGRKVDCWVSFKVRGVPSLPFTQKSSFSLEGLPFEPLSLVTGPDQAGVTGFVYRSIGQSINSLVQGGVENNGRIVYFVFHTGSKEAHADDTTMLHIAYYTND